MDKMNPVTIKNCLGLLILDWIESILGKEVINEILQSWECNDIVNVLTRLYVTACEIKRKEVRKLFEISLKEIFNKETAEYYYSAVELLGNAEMHDTYIRLSTYDGCTGEGIHYLVSLKTGKWINYSDGVADGQYDKKYDQLYSERVQEWMKENIPELAMLQ